MLASLRPGSLITRTGSYCYAPKFTTWMTCIQSLPSIRLQLPSHFHTVLLKAVVGERWGVYNQSLGSERVSIRLLLHGHSQLGNFVRPRKDERCGREHTFGGGPLAGTKYGGGPSQECACTWTSGLTTQDQLWAIHSIIPFHQHPRQVITYRWSSSLTAFRFVMRLIALVFCVLVIRAIYK